jgi:integrase
VLESRRKGPDGEDFGPDACVFGNEVGERIGNIKTAWRAACKRAGIKDLRFHDLRLEFTSAMLDEGVPVHLVRDWVGPKNIATTNIYANTTLGHMADALSRFEARKIDWKLTEEATTVQ